MKTDGLFLNDLGLVLVFAGFIVIILGAGTAAFGALIIGGFIAAGGAALTFVGLLCGLTWCLIGAVRDLWSR